MYNILRLFCENLKAIEVKLTEIYSYTCKSPTVRTAAATTSYLITVFFSHFAFSKPVTSVAQNLLDRSF